jgi:hypothetical protein
MEVSTGLWTRHGCHNDIINGESVNSATGRVRTHYSGVVPPKMDLHGKTGIVRTDPAGPTKYVAAEYSNDTLAVGYHKISFLIVMLFQQHTYIHY